ncbi:MAG TPA: hypothetical protein VFL31_03715 [Nitrospiraceae bacterium]|nr:hypothetical protein [Nitrospiraceae bacterium]
MNRTMLSVGLRLLIFLGVTACAPQLPPATSVAESSSTALIASSTPLQEVTLTSAPAPTVTEAIPITGRLMKPADRMLAPGTLIYDVESSGVAAPYGDSYRINRLERPFLQNMLYVPDLDIVSFNLSEDVDWYYVSIELKGFDPNNSIGINYGVEIDVNGDGYGDSIVWAHPPYGNRWDTTTVQVFVDSDHDSAGRSSEQSDAVFDGNGYDRIIFDGESSENADPDLAWVRSDAGENATVQFALKKSWIGSSFQIGVISDAGLKDVSKFDYNDRFTEADAGSPVRTNSNYPLGALYAVDNTCWQSYGFGIQTPASEPKFCPTFVFLTATAKPQANGRPPTATALVTAPVTEEAPTHQPQEPSPTACVPDFDPLECGDDPGYNEETCQCNIPTEEPTPTDEPVPTDPPTEEPTPTDPPVPTDPPTEPATEPPQPTDPPARLP